MSCSSAVDCVHADCWTLASGELLNVIVKEELYLSTLSCDGGMTRLLVLVTGLMRAGSRGAGPLPRPVPLSLDGRAQSDSKATEAAVSQAPVPNGQHTARSVTHHQQALDDAAPTSHNEASSAAHNIVPRDGNCKKAGQVRRSS